MRIPPARRDGDTTRQFLLDTAERLFATQGVDAVSVRTINAEAGVAAAATHYHFGGRDGLLAAVLERRGLPVMEAQLDVVAQLERRRARPTARQLIDIIGRTIAAVLDEDPVGGRYWTRIVGQLSASQDDRLLSESARLDARIHELVGRAFPEVDAAQREQRWLIAANTVINLLGSFSLQPAASKAQEARNRGAFVETLLEFVASGLEASMRSARRGVGVPESADEGEPARITLPPSRPAARATGRRPRRALSTTRR